MKRQLLLSAAIAVLVALPAGSVPTEGYGGGIDQAHIFSKNGTLTNAAATVSFGTTSSGGAIVCSKVAVVNLSTGTDTLFVQFNGTAASGATTELKLNPGVGYQYVGSAIHSISVFSSGTGVPYSVIAN